MTSIFLAKISDYVAGKDGNKPHLMANVFAENASLDMLVNSENISFPSHVIGRDKITEVLVKGFNQSYENIYTICLSDSLSVTANELKCAWLVGMTDKESQTLRFGYGQYTWQFQASLKEEVNSHLVEKLTIRIDEMINLPSNNQSALLSWLNQLDSPWASLESVLEEIPKIEELESFKEWLLVPEKGSIKY